MQYKKKTKDQRFISNLRRRGASKVCKLLDANPHMSNTKAKQIVESEIRKKYRFIVGKKFKL